MLAPYLAVAVGGALGAISRYLTTVFAQNIWGLRFPYGTLIVNSLGALIAGFFIALLVGRWSGEEYWRLFVFTGFLGGYTTFSSYAVECYFMLTQGQWHKFILNMVLNNVGSIVMVVLGAMIARLLIVEHLVQP